MPPYSLLQPQVLEDLLYYAQRTTGAMAEIGVYQGGSAWHLAQLQRPLYLYDTFSGMPHQGPLDGNCKGAFCETSVEAVRIAIPEEHVAIIPGVYPDSLIDMEPLGFVHADADQYESTRAICQTIPERMLPGGILLFDDFEVPGCEGCTQAVKEHFTHIARTRHGKGLILI